MNLVRACSVVAIAAAALTSCSAEQKSADDQTFVSIEQVTQWIADHECDASGAQKGAPGYGGEGMGQIAQLTFVCDNGKTFDIRLQNDGTYKFTQS